ncbi:MAG: hypothetical protein ACE361_18630 [Aureliella sp.]
MNFTTTRVRASILSSRLVCLLACVAALILVLATFGESASAAAWQDIEVPDFEMPAEAADFGSEDFAVDDSVSADEAATAAFFAAGLTALCTSVPALIIGIVVGYLIGRKRSKPTATDS